MKARITVLCENTVGRRVGSGEHGFSAFIETDRGNYLFDTGNGNGLVLNSLALKKDLRTIQGIFLSHGHSDHTGGLPEVLKLKGPVDAHAHPQVFSDRIAVEKEGGEEKKKFIGMIHKRTYLEFLGANFILNTEFAEVAPGMCLTGEVPRLTSFENPDPRLFVRSSSSTSQDPLWDDQSLVLDTPRGLILILGCAHAGLVNILHHVMAKTGKERFHAILGGTHLDFLTAEQLDHTIQALMQLEVERIGVSHCTGMRAALELQQAFGDRFSYGCVGSVLET